MKILGRILALFLIMPVVELFCLVQLEKYADQFTGGYGLLFTLVVILVTGILGSLLAKREGLSVWNRLKGQLDSGGLPGKELLDGVIILIAGALLITPGVLTDVVGFIGLIPFTRAPIRKLIMRRIKKALRDGTIQTSFGGGFGEAAWPGEDDPYADEADPSYADPYGSAGFETGGYESEVEDARFEDVPGAASEASNGDRSERQGNGESSRADRRRDALRSSEEVGQPPARGEQRDAVEDE